MIEQEAPEILRRFNGANQLEKLQDRAKNLISRLQDQSKDNMISAAIQPVFFVSAGAGDAGMLTCDGAAVLHDADVVLHDRLVSQSVLDLCRREAIFINVGKTGFGSAMQQDKINQILVEQAKGGQKIVRLKGGDAGLFGRLDEEIAALDQHDIHFRIIAGVTTASAMAAEMGVSLTQRARNRQVSFITGYQLGGFAEHDWRQLACPDMVTAIYMGRRACAYVQGRLMMFGADPQMPVTIAQNVGTKKALYCASTLGRLSVDLGRFEQDGPVLILFNLKPHKSFEQRQIDTVWQTDKLFQHKAALSL